MPASLYRVIQSYRVKRLFFTERAASVMEIFAFEDTFNERLLSWLRDGKRGGISYRHGRR